jgi:PAS domain S-box-containing protein
VEVLLLPVFVPVLDIRNVFGTLNLVVVSSVLMLIAARIREQDLAQIEQARDELETRVEEATAELRRSLNELQSIQHVTQNLLALRPLRETMSQVAEGIVKYLDYDMALLTRYSPDDRAFSGLARYPETKLLEEGLSMLGRPDLKDRRADIRLPYRPGENPVLDRVMSGEAVVSDSLADFLEQWVPRPIAEALQKRAGRAAYINLPLRARGRTVGTILAGITEGPITPEQQQVLVRLADVAAVAIENARLHESVENELAARVEAEQALHQSEARYRTLVEQIPAVTWIAALDEVGSTLYVSPQIETMLGFTADEWTDNPEIWSRQVHPQDRERVLAEYTRSQAGREPFCCEYRLLTRDGRVVWVQDEAALVRDEAGQPRLSQGVMLDVTERVRMEEQIRASLQEKEVLLREVHHRVKNNLQVVSSLLGLQAEATRDRKVLAMFQETQRRVKSMALIHERLYRSENLARIDFAGYAHNLTMTLLQSYRVDQDAVHLAIDVQNVALGLEMAVPCGLIINELVSNALKHAFPPGTAGEIRIALRSTDGEFILTVSDTGAGFPPGLDFRHTETLGLQLVILLVEQLGGTIELHRGGGTRFEITFAEVKHKSRGLRRMDTATEV